VPDTTVEPPSPAAPDPPERSGISERILERFTRRAERAIARRRIFRYLAGAMLVLALAAGVLARLVAPRDFESLGDALWWALVTVATVGYGDVVPTTGWGRVIGSAVIVMGVTFLAILTATVTSYLIAAEEDLRDQGGDDETQALLREVLDRLEAVEDKLDRRDGDEGAAPRATPPAAKVSG
jgi:voltage-gated potassium channel